MKKARTKSKKNGRFDEADEEWMVFVNLSSYKAIRYGFVSAYALHHSDNDFDSFKNIQDKINKKNLDKVLKDIPQEYFEKKIKPYLGEYRDKVKLLFKYNIVDAKKKPLYYAFVSELYALENRWK